MREILEGMDENTQRQSRFLQQGFRFRDLGQSASAKIHKFRINKKMPLIQKENIVRSAKLLVMEGAISRILDPDPNSPASSDEYPIGRAKLGSKFEKNLVTSLEKTLNQSLQGRLLFVLPSPP